MHPIIFQFGKFKIYSYSLMVVIAFFCAFFYAWFEAKRLGEDRERVIDFGLLIFISAFVGARLLHILVNWRIYFRDPIRIFKFWEGGLVFYGGLILAVLVCVAYIKIFKLNLARWADILAPCAMIALSIGRIGCFLNGCCYGSPAPSWLPWKVVYPTNVMPLHLAGVPLHPTPIYSSIGAGIIAGILFWKSRHKRFEGEIFWLMLTLYAVDRFILEFFRADPRGGIPSLHLSTSQIISIPCFLLGVCFLIKGYLYSPSLESEN